MPALIPTDHYGTITWLGHMTERREPAIDGVAVPTLDLGFDGIAGVPYGGRTRPSCTRVKSQHPKGTEIANVRQLSIVSAEELAEIAAQIGLDALDPAWLGASVVVEGIPDFTHVPPSARLQSEAGTTLVIDMENRPCHQPGLTIARHHGDAGKGFKAAAKDRRGVTAWVERPGPLRIGDTLRLHVPDQRAWAPETA
ncbi:MOSC domain-containing protein [Tateyamaria sp. SN6-1]|uniref:MOSC domain-containing protein n=1 Tax=Tateyamaria sp. SN6-1 TaxID=3092148 RepID=UPI0039F58352